MKNKRVNEMSKFVLKGCPNLVTSTYADGTKVYNECSVFLDDKKCYEVEGCVWRKIAENLLKVVNSGQCSRCDGCGYLEGCGDETCGTLQANESLKLMKVKVVK